MKKNIALLASAFAFMILLCNIAAAVSYSSGGNIVISMISQDPDPAEPGKYVDLRFKIDNYGMQTLQSVTLELLPEYPFSLDPGVSSVQNIGTVWSTESGTSGIVVLYKVRVDQNALSGSSTVKLRYKTGTDDWVITNDFDVRIKTHDNTLTIDRIESNPKNIIPGQQANIKIILKNYADTDFKDVNVRLDLSSASMPFAPLNSASEKKIKLISAGESAEVDFDIISSASAASQFYKVPILINYSDFSNNNYAKTEIAALIVGDVPDIVTTIDSSTAYNAGAAGNFVVKFINKGVTDIKFMYVKIQESGNFAIIGPSESYIGKLDSDDYQTAEFKIYIKKTENGKVVIPMHVEYRDANNNKYEKELNLELKTYTGAELKRYGLNGGSSFVGILIFVLIVAGGIFLYRRWKRKNRQKKK